MTEKELNKNIEDIGGPDEEKYKVYCAEGCGKYKVVNQLEEWVCRGCQRATDL